jgi:PAS domain S-box-containing protein
MVIGDDGQEHDERLADVFVSRPRPLKDLIACALRTVDPKEMQFLLQSGSWFQDLVVAVEDLPISVTLATAREDRRGFPLVYVNKSFERETGYSRKEIVGQNCRFLQSRDTEREQVHKIQYALRCAQPVKVALTNVRKDGEEFVNLLAMKPIFNSHGIYSYVVGVQYDVSHQQASLRELRVVNELLTFLPNVLKL